MHEVQNWVGGVTIFLIYDPAPKTTNQTSFYFFFFFFLPRQDFYHLNGNQRGSLEHEGPQGLIPAMMQCSIRQMGR